jgi:hypothetical protein
VARSSLSGISLRPTRSGTPDDSGFTTRSSLSGISSNAARFYFSGSSGEMARSSFAGKHGAHDSL